MGVVLIKVTDTLEKESALPMIKVIFPSWFLSMLTIVPLISTALFKYKALALSGTIVSIDKNQEGKITLIIGSADSFSNVSVTLISTAPLTQKIGETITIKGVCTGALSDVIVTEGVVKL